MLRISTVNRSRLLAIWLTTLAAATAHGPSAVADSGLVGGSPEGFSASSEGLPEPATDAWYATVLTEGRKIVWPMGGRPVWRTKRGSGIVVMLDDDRGIAVVATNAHNITCDDGACDVRVGFGDPFSAQGPKWAETVRVVSRVTEKDLAFVEVIVPDGAEIRAARFASAECSDTWFESVVSIGWPDLRVRRKWGVKPPPNHSAQVKRYSAGLFLRWLKGYRMKPEVDRMMERLQVVFHNADVLPGSSGGPLLNRDGGVVGINTMIVSNSAPDHNRFCARRDPHRPGECVHVAIASKEVVDEYERVYASRITLADCSSSSEYEMGR